MANTKVKDISLLDKSELEQLTVPSADERGTQAGVIPPGKLDYTTLKYKVVSMEEAEKLLHMRTQGTVSLIGLDTVRNPKPILKPTPKAVRGKKMDKSGTHMSVSTKRVKSTSTTEDYDPYGVDKAAEKELEPGDPALEAEERRLATLGRITQPARDMGGAPVEEIVTAKDIYLERRSKVTLELQDGSMMITVIDIKESPMSVTLVLSASVEGLFIPKAGTELNISGNGKSWHCFFPGTYFELSELGIVCLVFVKAD